MSLTLQRQSTWLRTTNADEIGKRLKDANNIILGTTCYGWEQLAMDDKLFPDGFCCHSAYCLIYFICFGLHSHFLRTLGECIGNN